MAVTKTLTKSIPHVKSSKAQIWDLEMTYENDSEGDATYYKSVFRHTAVAADGDFTKAGKTTFSLADLNILLFCSPRTHLTASTIFVFPHPLGPTITVTPSPNFIFSFLAKDLNPCKFNSDIYISEAKDRYNLKIILKINH